MITKQREEKPTGMQSRVLIVDDDAEMREALEMVLSADGHTCELAADATAAQEIFNRKTFDVVISYIRVDGVSGLELLDGVRRSHPALPFIAITGVGRASTRADDFARPKRANPPLQASAPC